MFLLIAILGFAFGVILQRSRLNTFDVIGGFAMLEDWTVPKALLVAVGVGAVLLAVEVTLGWATWHVKPLLLGGVAVGGLVFGAGMAILGYCPGTLAVSLGEGALDAGVGVVGGILAGWLFTLAYPSLKGLLGPNFGKPALVQLSGSAAGVLLIALVFGAVTVWFAFWLDRRFGSAG